MYQLLPKAIDDIRTIYQRGREIWGETSAERYYRDLFTAFRAIDSSPVIGTDYDRVRQGVKGYRVKSHIIFFTRHGHDVHIIRILHKAMDYQRHIETSTTKRTTKK